MSLPQVLFKHFASKNQLPGLSVHETLVETGLIYKIYLFCGLHILEKWGSNFGKTLTTLWALAPTDIFNIFLHWNTPNQDPNKSLPTFFCFSNIYLIFALDCFHSKRTSKIHQSIAIKRITYYCHPFVQQSVRNECKELEVNRFSSFRTGVRQAHKKFSSGKFLQPWKL